MLCRVLRLSEEARSSPACPWADRSQSSFPYSPARSLKLPAGCSFQVCAFSCWRLFLYLKIGAGPGVTLSYRRRKINQRAWRSRRNLSDLLPLTSAVRRLYLTVIVNLALTDPPIT